MCDLVSIKSNTGEDVLVASIKAPHIKNIIDRARECSRIEAIILFGSSLEERCNIKSDIDIAIISKYTINSLSGLKTFRKFMDSVYNFDMSQEYDRLYFKSIEGIFKNRDRVPIYEELILKGKIIYKRV